MLSATMWSSAARARRASAFPLDTRSRARNNSASNSVMSKGPLLRMGLLYIPDCGEGTIPIVPRAYLLSFYPTRYLSILRGAAYQHLRGLGVNHGCPGFVCR